MSVPGEDDAARAYKEVMGELGAAADALRARERVRAEILRELLVDLDAAMAAAAERAARSRHAVELLRDSVLEALADEHWLAPGARAAPDPDADPDLLDELDRAVDQAARAVVDAVRPRFRLPFGLG